MAAEHEAPDRSASIVGAIVAFVLVTFLFAAHWISTHWDLLLANPVPVPSQSVITTEQPVRSGPKYPLIAVSAREQYDQYDDIGALLKQMGEGYAFDRIPLRELADEKKLAPYKVLFLGCAAEMAPAVADIPSMEKFQPISILRDPYAERAAKCLETFVREGGALYASDWAGTFVERAFPRRVSLAGLRFPAQRVTATVKDRGLVDVIGPRLDLMFETDLWVSAWDPPADGQTYLEAEVRHVDGSMKTRPLLVSFKHGRGLVIFTSFHNQKQVSEKEHDLLKYLVLKPIVAAAAQQAQQVLVSQNCTIEKESLFSTGSGPKVLSYKATAGQSFTLVLSWNEPPGEKASLELKVTSPSGKSYVERSDAPPVKIQVDAAEAGDYQYTVEPVKVPFSNFPYVVTVGARP